MRPAHHARHKGFVTTQMRSGNPVSAYSGWDAKEAPLSVHGLSHFGGCEAFVQMWGGHHPPALAVNAEHNSFVALFSHRDVGHAEQVYRYAIHQPWWNRGRLDGALVRQTRGVSRLTDFALLLDTLSKPLRLNRISEEVQPGHIFPKPVGSWMASHRVVVPNDWAHQPCGYTQ